MQIYVENYARPIAVTFMNFNCEEYESPYEFSSVNEALDECRNEIDNLGRAMLARVYDANTGEIYVTCHCDEQEDPDYEPPWIDDDCGFDPYLGMYTDDC